MNLVSNVIHYPIAVGVSPSAAVLSLENDRLTLITEGISTSLITMDDVDKVLIDVPIQELEGYSHYRRGPVFYLYVKGKRYPIEFVSNVSITKSIWNSLKKNEAASTDIDAWLEVFDFYGIKKRFNLKGIFIRVGVFALMVASYLFTRRLYR